MNTLQLGVQDCEVEVVIDQQDEDEHLYRIKKYEDFIVIDLKS